MPGVMTYSYKRTPKKRWRYPGVPIPERLKHKYEG